MVSKHKAQCCTGQKALGNHKSKISKWCLLIPQFFNFCPQCLDFVIILLLFVLIWKLPIATHSNFLTNSYFLQFSRALILPSNLNLQFLSHFSSFSHSVNFYCLILPLFLILTSYPAHWSYDRTTVHSYDYMDPLLFLDFSHFLALFTSALIFFDGQDGFTPYGRFSIPTYIWKAWPF